jgi:hypothetical protein
MFPDAGTTPDAAGVPTVDAAPGTPDAAPPTADAAAPVAATLTHSLAQTIVDANSVSCNDGFNLHSDNGYLRVFDLPAMGITSAFSVTTVEVGIESATAGVGGVQPATVNLYTLSGPLTYANMTRIGTAPLSVLDQDLTVLSVPITGTAPAGSTLVVEFFTPDGQLLGHSLFMGSNTAGQTGPSYLSADDCGATNPTDVSGLGFPEMHIVMNVTGTHIP